MAELDLKGLWKKGESSLSDSEGFDLDKSIQSKSKDVLQKIKFILTIEFWLNNVITTSCSVFYYIEFGPFWGIFTGIVFLIYFFYYSFLINAIKKFDYAGEVKNSLKKIYNYLRFYVLHYKVVLWICFLIIPYVAFGYGFFIGYSGEPNPEWAQNTPQFEFTKSQAYIALGIIIVLPLLITLGCNYLISLIYDRKIKKLKAIVNGLDN
ncbi:hypothetical protein [Fulvivirga lutimaris]|uniref:hypothetical protein n=1 Tax=Fulvivirga lutimaris TaxID=1819566 RepID=UPI0012BCF781|nr:hypothetical protein [Fulvivirga lutimaris]MTI41457.1 hypothetical protein [Fulvivirga lutimaris]